MFSHQKSRPRIFLVVSLALAGTLYFALLYLLIPNVLQNFASSRLSQTLVRMDFLRFWYVGQRLLEPWPHVAEAPALLKSQFPTDILSTKPVPLDAWLYPPTTNLLAMLFALLPMTVSFWAWSISTVLISTLILRFAGLGWTAIIIGLSSPADMYNFVGGQIGLVMGSILVSCLLTIETRPRFAGVLAGCLSFKPQLGIALVAMLPGRARRVWLWLLLSLFVLFTSSLVIEGFGAWSRFFAVAGPVGTQILVGPFKDASPIWSISVFMMMRSFGAPLAAAWVIQFIMTVLSLLFVGYAWHRQALSQTRRMAFTVAMSCLMTPYGFVYDLSGFGIAMAAMGLAAPDRTKPIFAFLWLMSGYHVTIMIITGRVVFPLAAVLAAVMCHPFASKASSVQRAVAAPL